MSATQGHSLQFPHLCVPRSRTCPSSFYHISEKCVRQSFNDGAIRKLNWSLFETYFLIISSCNKIDLFCSDIHMDVPGHSMALREVRNKSDNICILLFLSFEKIIISIKTRNLSMRFFLRSLLL